MSSFKTNFKILFLVLWVWSCSKASDSSNRAAKAQEVEAKLNTIAQIQAETSTATKTSTDDSASVPWKRSSKVSAHDIDNSSFLISRFVVALQPYVGSETPVLTFDKPKDADWVEVIRCRSNVNIAGGADNIQLENIELSSLSSAEKDRLYRNNDFFRAAKQTKGCVIISTGSLDSMFYDSWAPSGSYRYLLSACVSQERLTDQDSMSNRNCSRQVAISPLLKDYVNARLEDKRVALEAAAKIGNRAEEIIRDLGTKGREYGVQLDSCATTEHDRAAIKVKRDAITSLVAIGLDMALEFAVLGKDGTASLFKGWKSPQSWMSRVQTLGALGGWNFRYMFLALTANSQDMPRSCSGSISLDQQISNDLNEFQRIIPDRMNYLIKADVLSATNDGAGGTLDANTKESLISRIASEEEASAAGTTPPDAEPLTTGSEASGGVQ